MGKKIGICGQEPPDSFLKTSKAIFGLIFKVKYITYEIY